jgi:hypothetical protein
MLETALVATALVAAGFAGLLAPAVTSGLLMVLGLGTLLLGLALGVGTGLRYHVILYRLVAPKVSLSRTWWLSPSALHRHLSAPERHRLSPWYQLGGIGFVLCVAGGLAAILGALLARW